MLEKIEQISNQAQITIETKYNQLDSSSQEYQDLVLLKNAYTQLNVLMQAAKDQHATVGAYILSCQLSQTEQELNAAQLLHNFLKVLNYSVVTTFRLDQKPSNQSCIDTAKMFSMFPFIFMVALCALFPPVLVMSFMPPLMLCISALPLAITYACDKPFSMSRFYQEMAGIEKALAYAVLTALPLVLMIGLTPEVSLLMMSIMFISILGTGLTLLWHSNHLQTKHEHLKDITAEIKDTVNPRHHEVLRFFSPQTGWVPEREHFEEIKQTLLSIS